jgi:hypothetical protein
LIAKLDVGGDLLSFFFELHALDMDDHKHAHQVFSRFNLVVINGAMGMGEDLEHVCLKLSNLFISRVQRFGKAFDRGRSFLASTMEFLDGILQCGSQSHDSCPIQLVVAPVGDVRLATRRIPFGSSLAPWQRVAVAPSSCLASSIATTLSCGNNGIIIIITTADSPSSIVVIHDDIPAGEVVYRVCRWDGLDRRRWMLVAKHIA